MKELSATKAKLEAEVEAATKQTNYFWESKDSNWALYETGLVLKTETDDEDSLNRILCLNRETGVSVVSQSLGEDDKAVWLGDIEIPEDISIEAGKRLKKIAAEAEDDEE